MSCLLYHSQLRISIYFISSATPAPISAEKGSESTEVLLKSLQALQHLKKQPNILPEMEKVLVLNTMIAIAIIVV